MFSGYTYTIRYSCYIIVNTWTTLSIIALFINWSSKCKFSLLSTSTLRWLHLSLLQVIGVLCTHILYLSCLTELLNYIIVLFVIHWLFSYFPIHHSTSIFFSIPIQNILATISRISLVRDLASPNIVKLAFLRVDIKVRYVLWHSLLPESIRDNFSRSHTFEYEILITSENTPRYCT